MFCKSPFWTNGFWAPCGKCLDCRTKRSRDWSIRMMNEYHYWNEKAVFMTLTYDEANVPLTEDGKRTLCYKHWQAAMKKLRRHTGYVPYKFFLSGEYGPNFTCRPHYHVILFGLSIEESVKWFKPRTTVVDGELFVTNKYNCWPHGHVDIGYSMSTKCCAYTAQYTYDKLATRMYEDGVKPPFMRCSKGIGERYALDHAQSLVDTMFIKHADSEYGVPRYYFKVLGVNRRDLYKKKIYEFSEKLVVEARESGVEVWPSWNPHCKYFYRDGSYTGKGISVFYKFDKSCPDDNDTYHKYLDCIYRGHVIDWFGRKLPVTEEFHRWLWSKRFQHELNHAARLGKRKRRDKVL